MDAFQYLGFDRQAATLEILKKAWKKALLLHHPDKNRHCEEEAHNITIELNRA